MLGAVCWCDILLKSDISILVRHGYFIIRSISHAMDGTGNKFKVHNQVDNFVSSKYYPPAVPAQAGQWQCTVSVSGR